MRKSNNRTHLAKSGWLSAQFSKFAQATATWTGHPIAFLLAAALVVVWIVTGPIFDYSNTWQLVINTGTTIVTFLMVFLIQNTQNRDMMAVQLKLSELVLAMKGAQDKFAAIEDLSDEELEELHEESRRRAEMMLSNLQSRRDNKGQAGAGDDTSRKTPGTSNKAAKKGAAPPQKT